MKLQVTFLGPHQQRIQFVTFVYLQGTYTHILINRGKLYNHYLRLYQGTVEIVRFHQESEEVLGMRPYNKYPLKHAARVYLETTLPKTDEAMDVLMRILASDTEGDDLNFLPTTPAEVLKREKPTKTERMTNKANSVTLEQIAQDLNITPQHLRGILRNHDYKKPGARWQWPKTERERLMAQFKKFLH